MKPLIVSALVFLPLLYANFADAKPRLNTRDEIGWFLAVAKSDLENQQAGPIRKYNYREDGYGYVTFFFDMKSGFTCKSFISNHNTQPASLADLHVAPHSLGTICWDQPFKEATSDQRF